MENIEHHDARAEQIAAMSAAQAQATLDAASNGVESIKSEKAKYGSKIEALTAQIEDLMGKEKTDVAAIMALEKDLAEAQAGLEIISRSQASSRYEREFVLAQNRLRSLGEASEQKAAKAAFEKELAGDLVDIWRQYQSALPMIESLRVDFYTRRARPMEGDWKDERLPYSRSSDRKLGHGSVSVNWMGLPSTPEFFFSAVYLGNSNADTDKVRALFLKGATQ